MPTRDLDALTVAEWRELTEKVARHLGYCDDDVTDEERAEVALSIVRDTMRL